MSYTRKFVRKNKNGSVKTYYAEVESLWVNGKAVQRYIRPLGKDPEKPNTIQIGAVHFGFIATRLMQGDLTANELLDMLEGMGHRVPREDLEAVGIRYSFKKTVLHAPSTTHGSQESAAVRRVRQRARRGEDVRKKGDHALRQQ